MRNPAPIHIEPKSVFVERAVLRARELGLSNSEVARHAGLSERRFGYYVAPPTAKRSSEPKFRELLKICAVLNTHPNYLLGVTNESELPGLSEERQIGGSKPEVRRQSSLFEGAQATFPWAAMQRFIDGRGLVIQHWADASGIAPSVLYNWRRADRVSGQGTTYEKLARGVGMELHEFLAELRGIFRVPTGQQNSKMGRSDPDIPYRLRLSRWVKQEVEISIKTNDET